MKQDDSPSRKSQDGKGTGGPNFLLYAGIAAIGVICVAFLLINQHRHEMSFPVLQKLLEASRFESLHSENSGKLAVNPDTGEPFPGRIEVAQHRDGQTLTIEFSQLSRLEVSPTEVRGAVQVRTLGTDNTEPKLQAFRTQLGESEVYQFCRKHSMSDYDCHFVSWLVRHHLTMSWIAQREDTSDVGVIDDFARLVGDQEHLDNLYLLTVADIRGTSPHVWNDWKAKLLSDLYNLTTQALRRDVGSPILLSERIEDLKSESLTYLKDASIKQETAESVWSVMEDEYFVRNSPAAIAWHTRLLSSASVASLPLVDTINNSESGTTEVFVCAPDSELLLCNVTAGFDRENLNIVDARVHRTCSGLVVMIFVVLNVSPNKPTKSGLNSTKQSLRAQIMDPMPGKDPQRTRLSRSLLHFPIDTKVTFPKLKDQIKTIMVVTAQDRPGLLHQVARAFIECKTHLVSAKISTFGERVEDIFYITDRDGQPINDPKERKQIAETVCAALPS